MHLCNNEKERKGKAALQRQAVRGLHLSRHGPTTHKAQKTRTTPPLQMLLCCNQAARRRAWLSAGTNHMLRQCCLQNNKHKTSFKRNSPFMALGANHRNLGQQATHKPPATRTGGARATRMQATATLSQHVLIPRLLFIPSAAKVCTCSAEHRGRGTNVMAQIAMLHQKGHNNGPNQQAPTLAHVLALPARRCSSKVTQTKGALNVS